MPNMHVIDESNWQEEVDRLATWPGLVQRDYAEQPQGYCAAAPSFPFEKIDRSEWSARIKEKKERGQRNVDLMKLLKIPSLDQQQTNYCWVNGVVTAVYATRAIMGEPFVDLSPASVAAPIKGFRNQGGMGLEAIEWISQNGVCRASIWPFNAISRQYYTAEAKADAKTRLVSEWYDLQPRDFDQMATALLLGFVCPKGHNWWGHEVCAIDLEEIEPGHFGTIDRNSYGPSYGDDGFFFMTERKSTPDDCQALTVATATPV